MAGSGLTARHGHPPFRRKEMGSEAHERRVRVDEFANHLFAEKVGPKRGPNHAQTCQKGTIYRSLFRSKSLILLCRRRDSNPTKAHRINRLLISHSAHSAGAAEIPSTTHSRHTARDARKVRPTGRGLFVLSRRGTRRARRVPAGRLDEHRLTRHISAPSRSITMPHTG
jgi:hypothetical protein